MQNETTINANSHDCEAQFSQTKSSAKIQKIIAKNMGKPHQHPQRVNSTVNKNLCTHETKKSEAKIETIIEAANAINVIKVTNNHDNITKGKDKC